MPKPNIVVIGSINMDLVSRVRQLPKPGQTIPGQDLMQIPGGKGANQAVAAARLGANVQMIGRVGDDAFGPALREGLDRSGVDTRHVRTDSGPSGVALILLQAGGENSIVLSAGANARLSRKDIDAAKPLLAAADVVLLQLEIPLTVVGYAASLCRSLGVRVILDPAPAPAKLPASLFGVDVICPNESEAAALVGSNRSRGERAARVLLDRGSKNVVLKLGSQGSMHLDAAGSVTRVGAFPVTVVDTTAAGDSMTAGLAVALGEGRDWPEALRFANAAGALACTKLGAQPSIPSRAKVMQLLRENKTISE